MGSQHGLSLKGTVQIITGITVLNQHFSFSIQHFSFSILTLYLEQSAVASIYNLFNFPGYAGKSSDWKK